ncbi:MAG: hypothetical protein DME26_03475, partial [Verrucomicrobia bacterium]
MRHPATRLIILLVLLAVALLTFWLVRRPWSTPRSDTATNPVDPQIVARFVALEAGERAMDQTVWAKELLAQECGRVFESWWDSINAVTNKLRVLASLPIGEIVMGKFSSPQKIGHEIEVYPPSGNGVKWSSEEWTRFVEKSERAGWQLMNTEFRHVQFDSDLAGQPLRSRVYFRAHLVNAERFERAV